MVECPAGKLAGVFMRFTIRDLMWLTVVAAFGVGWWIDRRGFTALTDRVASIEARTASIEARSAATDKALKDASAALKEAKEANRKISSLEIKVRRSSR
jgi:hypothetical protein